MTAQNIALVLAACFSTLIITVVSAIVRSERKRWNKGACADCGTNWEYDPKSSCWYPGEGTDYVCGCGKHRMHIGWYNGAQVRPVPKRTQMLRAIDKLLQPGQTEANLRVLMLANTALTDPSGDYGDLDLHWDGSAIVFQRKRLDTLLTLTVGYQPDRLAGVGGPVCTLRMVRLDNQDVNTTILSSELLPFVFSLGGIEGRALTNPGVEHVHV